MADMKVVMMTFLLIVIALGLTPSIASMTTAGVYGLTDVEHFTHASGAGTSKACSLANATYIWNPSVMVTTNVSAYTPTWTVTSNTTAPVITVTGLTSATVYLITITCGYMQSAMVVSLLYLLPLLWVVGILAVGTVAIYTEFKELE
jgi:hypothetical protein